MNDKRGNPIEIAAVVAWRARDTAQACFDVDSYEHYVAVQSESAVRHLASGFAYDQGEENESCHIASYPWERRSFSMKRALERLTKEVNEAIAQGWEPLGGITVASGIQLLQLLIKRR